MSEKQEQLNSQQSCLPSSPATNVEVQQGSYIIQLPAERLRARAPGRDLQELRACLLQGGVRGPKEPVHPLIGASTGSVRQPPEQYSTPFIGEGVPPNTDTSSEESATAKNEQFLTQSPHPLPNIQLSLQSIVKQHPQHPLAANITTFGVKYPQVPPDPVQNSFLSPINSVNNNFSSSLRLGACAQLVLNTTAVAGLVCSSRQR